MSSFSSTREQSSSAAPQVMRLGVLMLGAHAINASPAVMLAIDVSLFSLVLLLLWRLEKRISVGRDMLLVALVAAVGIFGRILLEPLPNVQPVTILLLLAGAHLGWRRGVLLAVVITLLSNLSLGHGVWTAWQAAGWGLVAVAGWKSADWLIDDSGDLNLRRLVVLGFGLGFAFNWFVSLSVLHAQGFDYLWLYLLQGIPFDLLHAFGNFAFAALIGTELHSVFRRHSHAGDSPALALTVGADDGTDC